MCKNTTRRGREGRASEVGGWVDGWETEGGREEEDAEEGRRGGGGGGRERVGVA